MQSIPLSLIPAQGPLWLLPIKQTHRDLRYAAVPNEGLVIVCRFLKMSFSVCYQTRMGEWCTNVDILLPSLPSPPPPKSSITGDMGVSFGIHLVGLHINQVAPVSQSRPVVPPANLHIRILQGPRTTTITPHPSIFNFLPEQIMICLLKLRGAFVTPRADIFRRRGGRQRSD